MPVKVSRHAGPHEEAGRRCPSTGIAIQPGSQVGFHLVLKRRVVGQVLVGACVGQRAHAGSGQSHLTDAVVGELIAVVRRRHEHDRPSRLRVLVGGGRRERLGIPRGDLDLVKVGDEVILRRSRAAEGQVRSDVGEPVEVVDARCRRNQGSVSI